MPFLVHAALPPAPSSLLSAPAAVTSSFALPVLPAPALLTAPASAAALPAAAPAPAAAPTAAPALAAAPASAAASLRASRPPDARTAASAPAESLKESALDLFVGAGEAPAVDATADFKRRQRAVRDGRAGPLPAAAREHRFLLVPGFSWDALDGYFGPNLARLRSLGLDARVVETDPLGTSAANAERVRRAVEESDKPVVLIGHSKGGLDALKALAARPGLQDKVARLVAVQTPYRGTEIADWLLSRPLLRATALAYSRLLNPRRLLATFPFFRGGAVAEMTPGARRKAAAEAEPLRRGLKVYSLVSRVDDSTAVKILLWITAGAMKTLSGRHNDGLVAPEDAVLPGSRYALLEHVGHLDTVSDSTSWKRHALGVRGHDPEFAADLTEAVVRWVFARGR